MHIHHCAFHCRALVIQFLTRSSCFIAFLLFSQTGRELKGFKVTIRNDPTSPIFQSYTSGGISIAGSGIDIANTRTVTPVRNVDKHTREVETSYVGCKNCIFVLFWGAIAPFLLLYFNQKLPILFYYLPSRCYRLRLKALPSLSANWLMLTSASKLKKTKRTEI
jgi:hypothetical protein